MKILYASVLLLAGCALQEKGQWVKPDTTEAQWKQDNYECTRDATYYVEWVQYRGYFWGGYHRAGPPHYISTGPRMDPYLYEMCLDAKGYKWRPESQQ